MYYYVRLKGGFDIFKFHFILLFLFLGGGGGGLLRKTNVVQELVFSLSGIKLRGINLWRITTPPQKQ